MKIPAQFMYASNQDKLNICKERKRQQKIIYFFVVLFITCFRLDTRCTYSCIGTSSIHVYLFCQHVWKNRGLVILDWTFLSFLYLLTCPVRLHPFTKIFAARQMVVPGALVLFVLCPSSFFTRQWSSVQKSWQRVSIPRTSDLMQTH